MTHPVQGQATRDILTGIGITSLIIALSVSMPLLGFFTSLAIPLPVLFYRRKIGRPLGALVAAGALIVAAVVFRRYSTDILFFGELLWIGFLLGDLFERNVSVERTILLTVGAVTGTGLAGAMIYSGFAGSNLGAMANAYVAQNLRLTLELYQGMGVSPESLKGVSESLDQIQYVLVRILPSLALAGALFVTWINVLIARPLFKFRGIAYPDFGPLNRWKAPEGLVWGVITCGGVVFLTDGLVKLLGVNGLILLMAVYFFQGIAIVSFFFEKKRFPMFLRFFLYSLIAIQQLVLLVVIGLGFFDMWLNFRKLTTEPPGGETPPAE